MSGVLAFLSNSYNYFVVWFILSSDISATQLVLKAHKEAVNSLSGNGSTKLGTVATVVAAANSTALECSKEIEAAMQISLRNALGMMNNRTTDGPMDDLTIMKVQSSSGLFCLSCAQMYSSAFVMVLQRTA